MVGLRELLVVVGLQNKSMPLIRKGVACKIKGMLSIRISEIRSLLREREATSPILSDRVPNYRIKNLNMTNKLQLFTLLVSVFLYFFHARELLNTQAKAELLNTPMGLFYSSLFFHPTANYFFAVGSKNLFAFLLSLQFTNKFLGLTGVTIRGGIFPYLASQCFSTSSTPSLEYKEDRISGNKSELSLALDNGDSHTDRGLCDTRGSFLVRSKESTDSLGLRREIVTKRAQVTPRFSVCLVKKTHSKGISTLTPSPKMNP